MANTEFPARIHPILSRDHKSAIIFRRGPSKYVCTVSWNRKTDEFKVGQWLHGRIYERRSDITPDGKYIIYFAMNGKWESESKGSWTAISRAPWLKAIGFFPKGDCWNGGGLFLDNNKYWLNDGFGHSVNQETNEVLRDTKFQPETNYSGECPGVYYLRLQRDGWKLTEHKKTAKYDSYTLFEKALPKNWKIVKTAHEQVGAPEGKGCYWDEHALINETSGELLTFPNWEWAEFDDGKLFYCEKGCLFKISIKNQTKLGEPVMLYDFNDLEFEKIEAPYRSE